MKVYFVNSVIDYGSTGKIVRDLSQELIKEGHSVRMAYGRHDVKDRASTFDLSSKWGFRRHAFMSRFFGRHGLHSTKETKALIKDIEDFDPDVIHIHNMHGYYLNVPLFLDNIKKMDVKVLLTLHDAWLVSGSSAYFDFDGCKIWDEGCVINNNTHNYPSSLFIKRQKKNFEWKKKALSDFNDLTLVSPSQWLQSLVSQTFLKEYKCVVVNNGIDTSIFKRQKSKELEERFKDKKVILGVSNIWEKRKGLEDFIALSKVLDDSYQVVLIGLNKSQIDSLPEGVYGLERTNNALELAHYYSLAYAYINPTYEDNYPTTNLEARACETNVIAYDTGGNKEVFGLTIVEQGDIMALRDEILKLDQDYLHNDVDYSKEKFVKEMMNYY